jgi:hypothetical protein
MGLATVEGGNLKPESSELCTKFNTANGVLTLSTEWFVDLKRKLEEN